MTLTLTFIIASLVVGIAQIVDAVVLIRQQGLANRISIHFAFFEYAWAAFCLFLLLSFDLGAARWLAIIFIAYIPLSVVVGMIAAPNLLSQPTNAIRLPMVSVYFGGLFGVAYSVAAIVALGA